MRVSTALNRQGAAILRICDIYSSARSFGLTHREMMDRLLPVWTSMKDCPRHVHEYVRGYERCLFDMMFRNDLEFCYLVEGVLYSTWRASHHPTTQVWYDQNKGHCLLTAPGAHYWRGTDKLFS